MVSSYTAGDQLGHHATTSDVALLRSPAEGPIGPSGWVVGPWPARESRPTLVWEIRIVSIERLTAEDEIMLWPDEIWPQDIGALAILDGGSLFDAEARFRIEAVRAAVAARLHLLPRLRQLLSVPPP